jgi:hypothetical protein
MKKPSFSHKTILALTATILAASGAQAYEVPLSFLGTNMPPLDFHGFLSQGFLDSSKYDYLANNTKGGSFKFSEAGMNVSMNPFPHTHIAAQGFLFDVGNVGEYQPTLDYALVDYNFSDAFGIRAGRIIRPEGIYNASQSIDLARTAVLLPQGLYDSRWRDFTASVDGGSVYGDIGLGKGGDLSYEVYAGMVNLAKDGGIARWLESTLNSPYTKYYGVNGFPELGGQLWWNTPLDGFRVGVAGYQAFGVSYDYAAFNPSYPLNNHFAPLTGFVDVTEGMFSLEYVWKNWTFQAENRIQYYNIHNEMGGQTVGVHTFSTPDAWYVGAAYRFNKWFEAGTYYTSDNANLGNVSSPASSAYQNDWAVSLRIDPKPWWVIKVEGHYLQGTALLNDSFSNPTANENGGGWFMLALKTTVSF